ncbi:unnamed protein product [Adineta steineri]|uniref:CBM21 domain-containing protein n=1 Tax=Adineta steineri TaxID=433720 RepID=A0A814VTK9_9BILA|nr:unnamed protein product [Adineta steineri]CAF1192275.1 unnamed protein product [Adineta steineri]CAF3498907.1 unnamed protein product [Adineta steineri]CAF3544892.1 unnamed protein product [Adineta steineri]
MALLKKSPNNTNTSYLSSNDKVRHYLQNSTCGSTINSITMLTKPSTNNSFTFQRRLRSCSENDSISSSSSSSSVLDEFSRSNSSIQSSLSDPIAHSSITSSNISSEEDIDFSIGFDQISDDDFDDDDNHYISNKNNSDAVTLLGEAVLDARLNEFDEFNRQSSNSTIVNGVYYVNKDDTIKDNGTKQQRRATFLYDSTNTLCSEDCFSAYAENDSGDEEDEHINGINIRSNSFSILRFDAKSTLLSKAPKKVVRFADMMGLDLESVRYMSPPDQTTSTLIPECVRHQFGQLRFGKNLADVPSIITRRATISSPPSTPVKQYNLLSKNFTSRTNIIPTIYENKVLLECLHTKDSTAYGTIRVHNCAFDKNVFIRLSQDEWNTSIDIEARHSMNYSHDNTDTFTFEINLPKSNNDKLEPKRFLFAVCLQAMWQEFWDNNQGWNYVLDVSEK